MEIVSETVMFGGRQLTISHDSASTGTPMRCAVFLPPLDLVVDLVEKPKRDRPALALLSDVPADRQDVRLGPRGT